MHTSSNRSVIVVSGLLTLLLLSGAALALGFHNGWLRTESQTLNTASGDSQPRMATHDSVALAAAKSSPMDPARAAAQDESAVDREKLDDAYRALDDAYAQIRVLQAPQVRLASSDGSDERGTRHDDSDDRRERRSRRHDADDH